MKLPRFFKMKHKETEEYLDRFEEDLVQKLNENKKETEKEK